MEMIIETTFVHMQNVNAHWNYKIYCFVYSLLFSLKKGYNPDMEFVGMSSHAPFQRIKSKKR